MKVEGRLWLDIDGQGTAGLGRIKLLEMIDDTGSIKKAAESMGMSYKAAWDNINTLNSVYGKDLVERTTGGRGGGGTKLTEHGRSLVKTYNYYRRIHELYLTDISRMNCIEAVIKETGSGYAVAETASGDSFACTLLDENIKTGNKVSLFIKPADIILINNDNFEASARNLVKTKVKSIKDENGISEIILLTDKGTAISVSITSKSAQKLGLAKGSEIFALFKTASVLATS